MKNPGQPELRTARLVSSLLRAVMLLPLAACGSESTPGRRVEVQLELATDSQQAPSDFTRADGWRVHLDEARVLLGPLYLRTPKRELASWRSLFLPRVHAHAQTLQEADVLGEYLEQVAFDALGGVQRLGPFESTAGASDSLSVMLAPPTTPQLSSALHGHQAFMRGFASKEGRRVDFVCGLSIDSLQGEPGKNLEARRRVDRVPIEAPGPLDDGMLLRLIVSLPRWLELVDFDDVPIGQDPCARPESSFLLQWYLGLRRPEAFRAELTGG